MTKDELIIKVENCVPEILFKLLAENGYSAEEVPQPTEIPSQWEKEFDKLFNPESLHLRIGKFYFKDEKEEIKKFIRSLLNGR